MAAMGVNRRRPKVSLTRVLRGAGFVYAVYGAALFAMQRSMLFPARVVRAAPVALRLVHGVERWTVPVDGGEAEAFLLLGDGVSAAQPGPGVVFAHGNGELVDDWIEPLTAYQRLGVSVLLPEFPGYGRSAGTPSEAAIRDALVAAYDRLRTRPEVDPSRIVFHGRSVGGGAICALAKERRPAALILQSTFTSVRAMASKLLLPGFLVRDPFDNGAFVAGYDGPVFIAHGTHDSIIPFAHAEALAALAHRARFLSYDADHNDCPPSWSAYMQEVEAFLRETGLLGR